MALLVRSWNVFHGNTLPPTRRTHLREMIELASADSPAVLCLQEVPVWALPRLEEWSGMRAFPAVARRGVRPAAVAGWVTQHHNGLLRSAISGQANVILVARDHHGRDLGHEQVSGAGVERRTCQAVLVDRVVVANVHATSVGGRSHLARVELELTQAFAERHAENGEPVVIAGDFNLEAHALLGYSAPGPGIDQILVRGASSTPLAVWPLERRVQNGRVLSDHAPVEVRVG